MLREVLEVSHLLQVFRVTNNPAAEGQQHGDTHAHGETVGVG